MKGDKSITAGLRGSRLKHSIFLDGLNETKAQIRRFEVKLNDAVSVCATCFNSDLIRLNHISVFTGTFLF